MIFNERPDESEDDPVNRPVMRARVIGIKIQNRE